MAVSYDVAVVGAGPAGLMAAWRARQAGHEVVLVEAGPSIGGMAASTVVGGQRVDLGSHRLHPAIDPRIRQALIGLLGADLQERPRHGRLRLADRWVAFPLEPVDLIRRLPPRFALGAARDAVTAPLRRRRASADSFVDVVRAGLGPTVSEWFYEPYVEKLWGVDPAELDAELARRRVAAQSASAIARRLMRRGRGPGRTFLYPRRGFGQICDAIGDAAEAAGADIRLSSPVRSLRVGPPHRLVVGETEIEAGVVLSTLPLDLLASIVDPAPPENVVDAAATLDHRAMVLLYLVLDRPQYTEFDAHYLSSATNPVSRLSEPKNYRSSADDPRDVTVLCAEVPCWVGDETWTATPEELGERVRAALIADGLPDPRPSSYEVRRLPRVYPQIRRGFAARQAQVEEWVDGVDGLLTLGRQGLFVGDNTHHVLAMGHAAADCIRSEGTIEKQAWRRAREQFRANVVED